MDSVNSDPASQTCLFCGQLTPHDANGPLAAFCPSCGKSFSGEATLSPSATGPLAVLDRFFQMIWQIFTRPGVFFRRMPPTGELSHALAFAIGLSWLSSALSFLWMNVIMGRMRDSFSDVMRFYDDFTSDPDSAGVLDALFKKWGIGRQALADAFTHAQWFLGTTRVLLDPFFTLVWLLFYASVFWVAAKVVVGSRGRVPVRFETILKIIAFSSAPIIFSGVIPLAGGLVSALFSGLLLLIGIREVFRVSGGVAVAVSIFPIFLVFAIIFGGVLLFAGLFGFLAAGLSH